MPRIYVPLTVNYDTITRPVANHISRDVMRLCDLDPKDVPLYLTGEFDEMVQPGSQIGADATYQFESFRRVKVTVDDKTRTDSLLNNVVRQNEQRPFLDDPKLGISLRPVYVMSDMTFQFRYTCATRQQAVRWRDNMAIRIAENRQAIAHEVAYNIPVQEGIVTLLAYLWTLREQIAGYGETFEQYFNSIRLREFSGLGTQDGDPRKVTIVIPEKQVPITGRFEFSDIPTEVKVDGNTTWDIEFSYNISYERCTGFYLVYPLMVHQQHISKKYFDDTPRFSVEELDKQGMIGITSMDHTNRLLNYLPPPADGLRFPKYDDWIPGKRNQPPYTVPCASWMISLDPKDPQDLLNLTQLPLLRFTLEMDTYLRANYNLLTKRGGTSVLFHLYNGDTPMGEEILTIDEHLNVRAVIPLDLRKQYHLRMSFPTYYPLFSKQAIRMMQIHWKATLQVFQSIQYNLDVEEAMTRLLDETYLPSSYIAWFYRWLQDHGIGMPANDEPFNTVNRGVHGNLPGGGIGSDDAKAHYPRYGDAWADDKYWSRKVGGSRFVQYLAIANIRE